MDPRIPATVKGPIWGEIIMAIVGKDHSKEDFPRTGAGIFIFKAIIIFVVECVGY